MSTANYCIACGKESETMVCSQECIDYLHEPQIVELDPIGFEAMESAFVGAFEHKGEDCPECGEKLSEERKYACYECGWTDF